MNPTKLALLSLISASVLLAGCTTPAKTADAQQEKPKAARQDDSVQYSGVGSWIPRKVKKKEDVIGTNTQTASQDALSKTQMQSTTHVNKEPTSPPGR